MGEALDLAPGPDASPTTRVQGMNRFIEEGAQSTLDLALALNRNDNLHWALDMVRTLDDEPAAAASSQTSAPSDRWRKVEMHATGKGPYTTRFRDANFASFILMEPINYDVLFKFLQKRGWMPPDRCEGHALQVGPALLRRVFKEGILLEGTLLFFALPGLIVQPLQATL